MRFLWASLAALGLAAASHQPELWSLKPVNRPSPPKVRNASWVRNPIDAFVLAKLEKAGVSPSPEADWLVLVRRVTLNLTGLPPTEAEANDFLNDKRPDAWERLVNRLLASPHYGEKWARHWLDQARYGDSDGYRGDSFRSHAWRWRHWVIDALNRDMPFDQFTIEQIAGDLLPDASTDQLVATGFQRNTLTNREGGTDPEQFRVEAVIDRANTVGTVWLGLTLGCAQCHDHKYDPISQRDYYRFFAFFNDAEEWDVDAPLPGELGPHIAARPAYDQSRAALLAKHGVPALQREWERRLLETAQNPGKWFDWDHAFDDLRTSVNDGEKLLRTPEPQRNRRQRQTLTDYFIANYHRVITKERAAELKFDELRKSLSKLDETLPPLSAAQTLRREPQPRVTRMLLRGDYRNPGESVSPGTPAILPPLAASASPSRLDLAHWLVSPENPLTARVIANRAWQEFFGRGIVKSSENFGSQGERPSHPELLDYLASELLKSGWRMKSLHRLIVTSAAYRQASAVRPELAKTDPDNLLLARQARVRLDAELIRDGALAASGLLDRTIGGPSGSVESYRRGVYVKSRRNNPEPFLANFDAPNGYAPVCRRMASTTPLQALNLMNDPVFTESARALALRLLAEPGSFDGRLRRAFVLVLGRTPSAAEHSDLLSYFTRQGDLLRAAPGAAAKIIPAALTSGAELVEAASWAGLASILMNTDEFVTRE
jgi:hypothetical protein